jgi:hypothetical protein
VNLFSGMSQHEIVSTILGFLLFNGYVVLLAISLAAFWVTSRPRRGRVRVASLWHMGAMVWFMLAFISTVWAAPVEKSFVDASQPSEPYFTGDRFVKVLIGLGFAVMGILCMVAGAIQLGRQKREAARRAVLAETASGVG